MLREQEGGVLVLTLNRPSRNNAWNLAMEAHLHAALVAAAADESVRVIVLTGQGSMFCPGLDSDELTGIASAGSSFAAADRHRSSLPSLIPKPIIAAVNGSCAGFGLVLALLCDVRFIAEEATVTTAFARRGLPGEEAVTWLLPRQIGHSRALELLLSGRRIKGAEAAALGLAHRALPRDEVLAAAVAYAADIALNCSPSSLAAIKSQVYDDWSQSLESSRVSARGLVRTALSGPDPAEGVRSLLERRTPQFNGLSRGLDPSDTRILGLVTRM